MRLIDGDEFSEQIGCLGLSYDDRQRIRERLNDAPTIDAVEQKHGHWNYYGYDEISNVHIYRCSECECGNGEATDYCPYCGSKMDEVTE